MNKPKSPIAETLFDIRQRYEDTSYLIYKEQQKRLAGSFLSFGSSCRNYVYSSYGNAAVVVRKNGNDVTKADEKPIESHICKIIRMDPFIVDENNKLENMQRDAWYLLQAGGKIPTSRVGHTFVVISDNGHKFIYSVGGANPNGSFSEIFVLDLEKCQWHLYPSANFTGRYEHAAFSVGDKIYVFGGANLLGNLEDIQMLNRNKSAWLTINISGEQIGARTHHTSPVITGDKLVIFSGGHSGADPVADDRVHTFDPYSNSWTTVEVKGNTPESRQGHVMVALGNKIYLHGGMAGETFYDDFYLLDFETHSWRNLNSELGQYPSARAAHGGIAYNRNVTLFGGMNAKGALNDMHTYSTDFRQWTEITFINSPPAPRLDFAMCLVSLSLKKATDREIKDEAEALVVGMHSMSTSRLSEEVASNNLEISHCPDAFVLIHGGMNTDGDIYDDCFAFKL